MRGQDLSYWLSRVHKLMRTAVKCESYHSMIMSRHFFPWCMFSYKLRMRTMYGPPDTRQWSSTSRLALGQSYRIWETERESERKINAKWINRNVSFDCVTNEVNTFMSSDKFHTSSVLLCIDFQWIHKFIYIMSIKCLFQSNSSKNSLFLALILHIWSFWTLLMSDKKLWLWASISRPTENVTLLTIDVWEDLLLRCCSLFYIVLISISLGFGQNKII